ncbi:hypothetical protein [Paraburkholderia susongensis]|uniref:Uncharacterized protein n=1 Tax=Paraburkholderia susongensis TaxID=1515439 RepID=A0A1X7LCB8_9BURK|nr:hypothetical protein [Paraburkholderia susongensis]SMG51498.1 hypothetical protein SAMN06265784_105451 [Paraburkholderia susongensis]
MPLMAGIFLFTANAAAEMRSITIVSGTYGENCGAPRGNMTHDVARHCNGRASCDYTMPGIYKDGLVSACRSDFLAEWHCDGTDLHSAALSAGAKSGDTLVLSCVESRGAGK